MNAMKTHTNITGSSATLQTKKAISAELGFETRRSRHNMKRVV
jgi:hypothetical protein